MLDIAILKNWNRNYYKCDRFDNFNFNFDGDSEKFSLTDAMGIGENLLMLPGRALLKVFDMLQPVAQYFKITCSTGVNSTEWMLGSGLLWLLLIAVVLQTMGWKLNSKPANG